MSPRVALTTYSVKPRGGVVHTLELAESLNSLGVDTTVVAMGDPDVGFFRSVEAPVHIIPAPEWVDSLEERVFSWIDAMTKGLARIASDFDILHSQDCISARAAGRVRTDPGDFTIVRTVHHVDDFTTPALVECQAAAIVEPDHVLVVSELWRRELMEEYGVEATVITNGVRTERFHRDIIDPATSEALRRQVGATDRHLFLTVGGIEPRKGSRHLIDALASIKAASPAGAGPVLAIIGGHSFQDYRLYREDVLGSLEALGLDLGTDVVLLGTVSDTDLRHWFHTADSFVFPSIKEGWGLVILEAQAAGLPVVASDINVFREFLTPEVDAILTKAADAGSLAEGMTRLMSDQALVRRLQAAGLTTAAKYSWSATAQHHIELYQAFTRAAVA